MRRALVFLAVAVAAIVPATPSFGWSDGSGSLDTTIANPVLVVIAAGRLR